MTKQLYEKENNINKPFFPVVRLEDIIDTISEKSIQWILNNYNHIYVEWKNNVVDTRLSVPIILRRNGLWITYNNGDRVITEYYIGKNTEIKDKHWQDNVNWKDYTNKLIDGTVEYRHLSESLKQLFNKGNITNFPDEEDLTSDGIKLSFKDREYKPENFSGLGRIILRKNIVKIGEEYKNILTQAMINKPNTVYEIRYDFDLNDNEIIIPENCVLYFQGGTLKNGIIIGNNTKINADRIKIFDLTIRLCGYWDIYEFSAEWFGAINNLSIDSTNFIQKSIDEISNIGGGVVTLGIGKFLITHTIYLKESIGLKGISCTKFRYQPNNNSSATILYAKFNNINSWVIDTYNYNTSTNELINYNSVTTGNSVDTNSISSTSDVFIENLRIISNENYIFGGIRFCNSPGFHRKNITIYGKFYNGICLCSSWNGIDEDIVSEAVLPFAYLYDVNSCVIINCISFPIQNIEITRDMYIDSVANTLNSLNILSKHCGLYGFYMYGVTFIGFCSEGGDIAKVYQQCNGIEDIGYYMEGIKEWYYYCQGTNLNIGKGFYLSHDSCKGIKLYLNNDVLDTMDIAQKGIEMTAYDFYKTNTPFQYLSKIVNYPSFISNLDNSIYFLSEDNNLYPGKGYLDTNHGYAHRYVIYRTLEFFRTLNSSIKNKFTEIRIAENSIIDVPNDRFVDISHIKTIIGEGEGATIKSYAKWIATFKSYNSNTTFKNIKFIIEAADYTLTKSIITAVGTCNFTFINCTFTLGNNAVFIDGETSFNNDGTIKTIKSHILNINFIDCVFNDCGTTAKFAFGKLNTLIVYNTQFPENLIAQYYGFNNIPVMDSRFYTHGPTSHRPLLETTKSKGFEYFDTSINKPIYWTGDKWIDATGTDV